MKVAYLVSGGDHAHCYGSDSLFTGLVNELGFANVLDYPEKPPLHCAVAARTHFDVPQRDACNITSDAAYALRGTTMEQLQHADVALIATHPGASDATAIAAACSRLPRSMPIAAIDASDRVENCAAWYEAVAGRPLAAYFKREYPIGETWAKTYACPLSYPASRVGKLPEKASRVFYQATNHGGGAPGIPRQQIVNALAGYVREHWQRPTPGWRIADQPNMPTMGIAFDGMRVMLTSSQQDRPLPEEYHRGLAEALIGISWNGAPNYDCNRFWENFAYGLCQVAERPRIQIPDVPRDGVHCFYVNEPEDVAPAVWSLLHDEDTARHVAREGHRHFLRYHSSEARARYVLKTLEAIG